MPLTREQRRRAGEWRDRRGLMSPSRRYRKTPGSSPSPWTRLLSFSMRTGSRGAPAEHRLLKAEAALGASSERDRRVALELRFVQGGFGSVTQVVRDTKSADKTFSTAG
ncbi:hypothetical protein Srubr_36770 [Streptomyces rubradiris]|uniref:Uncharacterized protein n=1 Tax=Streptomyces rubradiris TaxID=285531 RepID=A0ABQ3RDC2_STRRR|nr:hypothetical protein GCM10018792_05690 [Streptomyces rubradiris]GHI53831.1 hypothetical protein Srubr_36770 [Streptomyces rubradiris]